VVKAKVLLGLPVQPSEKGSAVTLGKLADDYIRARSHLAKGTVSNYNPLGLVEPQLRGVLAPDGAERDHVRLTDRALPELRRTAI
jgi:hypothetical protein